MNMGNGYNGKILRVNLTTGTIATEMPDDVFYRTYFGGSGIIGYYLLKEVPKGTDPLGPENKLIFAPGVVTGAPIAGSGRNSVGAKSPLTGGYGEADVGGFFGAELKRAGYDAIIVEGKAAGPVYLEIKNEDVTIKDATHLWGKTTGEAQDAMRDAMGEANARTALIGQGGENMVRYACVINDLKHAAGRTGMGAVMGSKNLKGVVVRGTQPIPLADPEKVQEMAKWFADNVKDLSGGMTMYGTPGVLMPLHLSGGLPTKNFTQGHFDGADQINGQALVDTILVKRENCFACPVYCKRVVASEEGYHIDPRYGGPEYETLGSFGSTCGVSDIKAISKANELCNAYSLDTISTGVTIAFAMECYEKGLLTDADTNGLELKFGNGEAMVKMVEMIAKREGFGDILAEGTKRAAQTIGKGAEHFAIQVKGQEVPMHEPRLKHALGLGYAVSPTGADHVHNIHDTAYVKSTGSLRSFGILEPLPADDMSLAKVRMMMYDSNWGHFNNCAVMCVFVSWKPEQKEDLVRAVTGWDTSLLEMMKVGERSATLARCFNVREGFTTEDDQLTERFYEPFANGPLQGVGAQRENMAAAIQGYYAMMGWDANGVPTKAKLYELGIGWAETAM
jgi:aldehyde:ferredoxin oxidoreductase